MELFIQPELGIAVVLQILVWPITDAPTFQACFETSWDIADIQAELWLAVRDVAALADNALAAKATFPCGISAHFPQVVICSPIR